MGGDCPVDEVAGRPRSRASRILLGASEPTVDDDVGDEARCELSGLGQLWASRRREIYHNVQRNAAEIHPGKAAEG
jgi:hypothetical protein